MSVPLNQNDYERFLKLAAAIMEAGQGEISIYTGHEHRNGGVYASIEMKTSHLSARKMEEIFGCTPLAEAPEPVKESRWGV